MALAPDRASGRICIRLRPTWILVSSQKQRCMRPSLSPQSMSHGLSCRDISKNLPERVCTLITKSGGIVHEEYHKGFQANSMIPLDGIVSTLIALALGRAYTLGLIGSSCLLSLHSAADCHVIRC